MNIFYMNQGGGGNQGTPNYATYDVILLAESDIVKKDFTLAWKSKDSSPVMSVQLKTSGGRLISQVQDLDLTVEHVRPLLTFTTTANNIRVVFVHLKSASEPSATAALNAAVDAVIKSTQFGPQANQKIIWIGDFNRADDSALVKKMSAEPLLQGGGQAWWNLDRAYRSGDWTGYSSTASTVSTSGDNGHIGIGVSITKAA